MSASITLLDYSNEKTVQKMNSVPLTAGNIVAQTAALGSLITAQGPLTLGALNRNDIGNVTPGTSVPPTNPFAQRELKWVLLFHDTVTNKKYKSELGTANATAGHLAGNTDNANFADADWVAYKTAFEGFVRSDDGNPVVLDRAVLVGRNT